MTRKEKLTEMIRRNRREMAAPAGIDTRHLIESSVKKSSSDRRTGNRLRFSAPPETNQSDSDRLASLSRRIQATRREMTAPGIDVAALIERAVAKSRQIPVDPDIASGKHARETAEQLKHVFGSYRNAPRTTLATRVRRLISLLLLTRAGVALIGIVVGVSLGAFVFYIVSESVNRWALTAQSSHWVPVFSVMTVTGLVGMAAYFERSLATYAASSHLLRLGGALPAVAFGLFFMFSAASLRETTTVEQRRTTLQANLPRHLAKFAYTGFGAGPEALSVDTGRRKESARPKEIPGGFVYSTKIKGLAGVTYEFYDLRFQEEVTVVGRITSDEGTLAVLSKAFLELDKDGEGVLEVLGASKVKPVRMGVACDKNVVAKVDTTRRVNAVTALLAFDAPSNEEATVSVFRLTERSRTADRPEALGARLHREVAEHDELLPASPQIERKERKMSPYGMCVGTLAGRYPR